jgi:hypothetical protein
MIHPLHAKSVSHVISVIISFAAGLAAIAIDESTGFSLGVIFVLFGGIWWLGRKLQALEDKMERAQEWREEVKHELDKTDREMRSVLDLIRRLPCNTCTKQ